MILTISFSFLSLVTKGLNDATPDNHDTQRRPFRMHDRRRQRGGRDACRIDCDRLGTLEQSNGGGPSDSIR
jgi:hypothetical protein